MLVPTTPNPTTGPRYWSQKDVIYLDMSVDEAVKIALTLGVVAQVEARPADGRLAPPQTGP